MSSFKARKLGDVVEVNPRKPSSLLNLKINQRVSFVPMAAVNEESGTIAEPQSRPYSEVRKGFTYFVDGDVIFAKITPCMQNGKSAVAYGLENGIGFGSTEFPVLRPNPDKVTPEWVWYFVRQPSFRREAAQKFRGSAGQQRVPESFLAEHKIPIPALEEQRRIVARIKEMTERVDEIQRLSREVPDELTDLKRSLVLGQNVRKEASVQLAELVEWVQDSEPVRPNHNYTYAGIRSFGRGLFTRGTVNSDDFAYKTLRRLKCGDFIYPKLMAWEGAFAMVTSKYDGMVVSPEFVVFRPKSSLVCTEVLDTYFRSPVCLEDVCKASTGSNRRRRRLNPKAFLTLRIPVPTADEQRKLKAAYKLESEAEMTWENRKEELTSFRESILRKAFAGEL